MYEIFPASSSPTPICFHAQGADTLTQFLAKPQPSHRGMITILSNSQLSFEALHDVLKYQLGRPLNHDLTGIPEYTQSLINRLYGHCVVSQEKTRGMIKSMCERFIFQYSDPALSPLSPNQTLLLEALLRYAGNHSHIEIDDIADQRFFTKLAKHAYIDECMLKHAYTNTAALEMFRHIPKESATDALDEIDRDKTNPLYLAAYSFAQDANITYASAGGLFEHFLNECRQGKPLFDTTFDTFYSLCIDI